ncbi:hypothetical protein WAI453_004918 [Rhynchosporium graminicola]
MDRSLNIPNHSKFHSTRDVIHPSDPRSSIPAPILLQNPTIYIAIFSLSRHPRSNARILMIPCTNHQASIEDWRLNLATKISPN